MVFWQNKTRIISDTGLVCFSLLGLGFAPGVLVINYLFGLGREHGLLGRYSILGLPWVRILRTDVYT